MSPSSPSPKNTPSAAPAAQALPDDQARGQVVDAAREIARAANLHITYATFEWEWCNDQGEPPYHGRVDMAFEVPAGTDSAAMSKQIAATAARQPGWSPGPPPGLKPFGDVAHKGGVMAIAAPGNYPERGSVRVFGECRNMNDHRNDTDVHDITSEIQNR